jgi:RNA polymerase sigma factor (sigma-70 family)
VKDYRRAGIAESVEVTEQVAVHRVQAGDREAYAVLVKLHAGAAHRAAILLGAGADAEDVVQTAFVKAFHALPDFRAGAAFRPWLLRIVSNEAKNAVRARARRRAATERLAGLGDTTEPTDPLAAALSDERQRELLDAVRRLPEPQRRVIVCRYLLDLDEKETAAVLGWPAGTVKSRLHRALRRLRGQVERSIEEAEHEH